MADAPARYPLSPGQVSLWTWQALHPGDGAYNLALAYEMRGAVDVPALRAAVADVLVRHEALRGRVTDGGELEVRADAAADLLVRPGWPDPLPWLAGEAAAPFDLARGPLLRVRLAQAGPDLAHLLVAAHHVVADERSMHLLVIGLADAYSRRRRGEAAAPAPGGSFGRYLRERAHRLTEPARRRRLDHWRRILHDAPRGGALPEDFHTDPGRARPAALHRFEIGPDAAAALRGVAARGRASEFMATLASYAVALARCTGRADHVVLTPVGDRRAGQYADTVGFFVDLVPVRVAVDPDEDFAAVVRRARTAVLGALANRGPTVDELLAAAGGWRDPRDNPLAATSFQLAEPAAAPAFAGLDARPVPLATPTCRVDLECYLTPRPDGGYAGELVYNAARYDAAAVAAFAASWVALLDPLAARPDRPVREPPLLDPAGEQTVRAIARGPVRQVDPRPLPHRIAEHAARAPDAPAVVTEAGGLTYRQLLDAADACARRLRAAGAAAGDVVAVCLPRSAEMVVAMLAVQRLGAAYLPQDPAHPAPRRAAALDEAGVRLAVVADPDEPLPPGVRAVPVAGPTVDELPIGDGPAPDDLAYVVYTSGSTGRPKGVMVSHRSLGNLLGWFADRYGVRPGCRVGQTATPAFDAHAIEIWPALAAGATVCLAPADARLSWDALARWIAARRVDVCSVPSVLAAEAIAKESGPPPARLFTGGETLAPGPSGRFAVSNCYGPTEATVAVTEGLAAAESPAPARPTIGRPLWNTEVLVLDDRRRPVPVGAVGEIYLGGVGVARGYLNRPDLTAERFVDLGDGGGVRYRTGDLGRWRGDGRLEFLGRVDRQVQVRGFRVEPAETEAALAAHPGVRRAVVVPYEGSLGAYVVPVDAAAPPAARELRAHLRALLPEPMIPATFATVAAVPLTTNGKVDRDALRHAPAPERPDDGVVAPRSAAEAALVRIWSEELRVEPISVHDSLFDLGANSLSIVRLAARLRASGYPVDAADLLDDPTVAQLAARAGVLA